ncbi:MAG: radical SAM protein, partial [Deltaproteobacteria bacterium]|nr:radical SAM protein [Deltaproteobacteria bacterium]
MVVRLGPSCNLACRFCPMERRGEPLPLPAVTEQLDAAVAAGAARVLLTGGEPTIRKDLHDVLRAVGERGLRLGLVTNGTTLVYDRLRAGLLRRGLDAVLLLLPALRPGTGDGLVRREGATALALEALGQLCQTPSLTLEVRIPLHDPGGEQALRDLVAHVASTVGKRQGAYVVLEAHAPLRPGGELAPLARSRAAELVVAAVDAAGSLPVYHSGLADCFAGDLARLSIDTAWRPFAPGPAHETCLHEPDATRVTKPLRCSECVSAVRCPGVPAWLAGSEGFAVTRPIPGVRSNSFDFTEAGDLPGFTPGGEDCPGAAQPPARGPLPAVYLVRDGRTTVFTTDTNSFTGDEIREISHRRQQLYIDVSDKVALDDYEQDVRQLRLLPACRPCPRRTACPSAFTVSDEVPFFRE